MIARTPRGLPEGWKTASQHRWRVSLDFWLSTKSTFRFKSATDPCNSDTLPSISGFHSSRMICPSASFLSDPSMLIICSRMSDNILEFSSSFETMVCNGSSVPGGAIVRFFTWNRVWWSWVGSRLDRNGSDTRCKTLELDRTI